MPRYDEFKNLYRLSERSDTNSVVDLVSDKYTVHVVYVRRFLA